MAGTRETPEDRLTLDKTKERRGRHYGTVLILLLGSMLVMGLLAAGLDWLSEGYIWHGFLALSTLIVLAGVVSSPAAVLAVGAASVVLGIVLPLTVETVADYVIIAPTSLAATTGLTWLAARRFWRGMVQVRTQRAQWTVQEKALTAQIETQMAELTALRQVQASWQKAAPALAAPVLPVWEGVLVLPFVGPLDEERAALARQTLLKAIETHRANTVILDATGLVDVTKQVIERLTGIIQAVELTGCQSILAGVRPPAARRMAELGAKLGNTVMRRNLQAGIAYALNREQSRAMRTPAHPG